MRRLLALVALVLAGSVGNAQATTITFEDHAVPFGTANPANGDLTRVDFSSTRSRTSTNSPTTVRRSTTAAPTW